VRVSGVCLIFGLGSRIDGYGKDPTQRGDHVGSDGPVGT